MMLENKHISFVKQPSPSREQLSSRRRWQVGASKCWAEAEEVEKNKKLTWMFRKALPSNPSFVSKKQAI